MLDSVDVLAEQEELLVQLVEAARAVPRDQRENFLHVAFNGPDILFHPGFPIAKQIEVITQDLDILARNGLLDLSVNSSGNREYWITPLGYRYYEHLKTRDAEPIEQVEREIRRLVESTGFADRYPESQARWLAAARALWTADSAKEASTVGHLCREAMQAFATELIAHYEVEDADSNPAHDVARVRAVLTTVGARLSSAERGLLDALLAYWGSVSDLVQRQEHGAQRERERLAWEDSRRVVFQTAVLFYEVDQSLRRVPRA